MTKVTRMRRLLFKYSSSTEAQQDHIHFDKSTAISYTIVTKNKILWAGRKTRDHLRRVRHPPFFFKHERTEYYCGRIWRLKHTRNSDDKLRLSLIGTSRRILSASMLSMPGSASSLSHLYIVLISARPSSRPTSVIVFPLFLMSVLVFDPVPTGSMTG